MNDARQNSTSGVCLCQIKPLHSRLKLRKPRLYGSAFRFWYSFDEANDPFARFSGSAHRCVVRFQIALRVCIFRDPQEPESYL